MKDFSHCSSMTPIGYSYNSCGYCKSGDGSPNYYGLGPRSINPLHYENLANRGWRRSGTTYYKPDARNACCPHYTIRLDSSQFQLSRSLRRVSNRFSSYIIGHEYRTKAARLAPRTKQEKFHRQHDFGISQRVHAPEYDHLPQPIDHKDHKLIQPAHKFEVSLEPDVFTEEKYVLYAHYQKTVHNEPPSRISKSGFRNFLCSGLHQSTYVDEGAEKERPIGSYHQCYRIDGRLVAMGVLDLLPHAVSSVYLIYHQDVSEWEFGKLSALREISMALDDGYQYYYMGYYIHSCAKMKYKREFRPTYVLDPESYEWNLFDEDLLARLDVRKYISLSREKRLGISATDPDPDAEPAKGGAPNISPAEAFDPAAGLFATNMPGIPSVERLAASIAPDAVKILYDNEIVASKKRQWDTKEMRDPHTFQGILAEFIACVGTEYVGDWILRLG